MTNQDLSEFNLGVGKLATDSIPLGESGIQAKVTGGSDTPVVLSDASLVLSPIVGRLDAGQVANARGDEEKGSKVGEAVGGTAGLLMGPLGSLVGAQVGKEIGGWAAGDHYIRFTLEEGSIGGSFKATYNPYLTLTLSVIGFSWLLDAKPRFRRT